MCVPLSCRIEREQEGGFAVFVLSDLFRMGRTACRVAATPARASCIVSYRNRNRNLTSIGVRVLHALRRQPIRTCLRNSASSPLSGRFFEKDFMILPFPLTASLAFVLRETWLCWGEWLPLFYLRFFVASGGGRGPSWPPCRGRKKLRSEDRDFVAREAGPADLPEPPLVASPHCRDARSWPRCHLVAVAV